MKLTRKLLSQLENSLWITLTPEQRVIMLYRYGSEPEYGWDEKDFVHGINDVIKQYPDHRPKPKLGVLTKNIPDDEPF
jgi:hypothetical protein